MDSLTHIVAGAAIGELLLGKKAGNRAVFWGALAGSLPDIDGAITPFISNAVDKVYYHRGFTHSLIFIIGASVVSGILLRKLYKKFPVTDYEWGTFVFVNMIVHIALDSFTTWGTQIFWPLPTRVEIKNIFVIDPFFTLPLLITVIWFLFYKGGIPKRIKINRIGLVIAWTYMLFTLINKTIINDKFEKLLAMQGINYTRYETKPAPFQNVLWSTTAETENGYYIGYFSYFDETPDTPYYYFPKNHELLKPVIEDEKVQRLVNITKGYYTIEKTDDGLVLNDLRFGQNDGWYNDEGDFIFSYSINKKENNKAEIQQKENSFANAKRSFKRLWQRIIGKQN